jgi:predicted nucleic acid-binding protein
MRLEDKVQKPCIISHKTQSAQRPTPVKLVLFRQGGYNHPMVAHKPEASNIILVDTSAILYYVEKAPRRGEAVSRFFSDALADKKILAVSAIVWTEALIRPLRDNDTALADCYRAVLADSTKIRTEPVDVAIAEKAAMLRARYNLPLADATHIATAVIINASAILTNDEKWREIPECPEIIIIDELDFDGEDRSPAP